MVYIDHSLPPAATVRHKDCELLLSSAGKTGDRCQACTQYRSNLRSLASKSSTRDKSLNQMSDPSSHVNYRYIRTPEKNARLQELHRRERALQKRLDHLQSKLDDAVDRSGR